MRHYRTAIAYALVIDRNPTKRANLIGLLNAQMVQVSNILSLSITNAGVPVKREEESDHVGLVDWFRQNPLTPSTSPTPSETSIVATQILTTPWSPNPSTTRKRKPFTQLSEESLNKRQRGSPEIQVRRSTSPASSDTENALQDSAKSISNRARRVIRAKHPRCQPTRIGLRRTKFSRLGGHVTNGRNLSVGRRRGQRRHDTVDKGRRRATRNCPTSSPISDHDGTRHKHDASQGITRG